MGRVIFTVEGKPQAKARPRVTRNGQHTYTPAKTKEYQKLVQWSFNAQKCQKLEGYIKADIIMCYPFPKSMSKKNRFKAARGEIRPAVKPDIDNVLKAVFDALNGLAYNDDNQIIEVMAKKVYAEEGRVFVNLVEINKSVLVSYFDLVDFIIVREGINNV